MLDPQKLEDKWLLKMPSAFFSLARRSRGKALHHEENMKTCRQCCKRAFCCFSFILRHQRCALSAATLSLFVCDTHHQPFVSTQSLLKIIFLSHVLSIVHIRCFAALKINSGAAVNSECKVDRSDSGTCNHATALSPTFHLVADLAARRVLPKQPEPCPMR